MLYRLTVSTIYSPSLDPVAGISVFAVLVILLSLMTTQKHFIFDLSPKAYSTWVLLWPTLFLLIAYENRCMIFPIHRRFADMSDFLADILVIAFGFGYALANFREGTKLHRFNGMLFSIFYGNCIAFWVSGSIFESIEAAFSGCIVFTIAWTPVMIKISQKYRYTALVCLCETCDYDLRGSAGQPTCPECGSVITKCIKPLNTSSADASHVTPS